MIDADSGPWFVALPEDWGEHEIVLGADESHHALRVLRIAPDEVVTVIDGLGAVARTSFDRVEDDRLVLKIADRTRARRPRPQMTVYQGVAKGQKTDEVVERVAELGVAELGAFVSERTVARWDDKTRAKHVGRWSAIARSVAKQSRNPFPMSIAGVLEWDELVRRVRDEVRAVVLWEEATLPLRTALEEDLSGIALVVGPEGGLTEDEAHELAGAGAALVSLGPHILRTENAAFAAVAAIAHRYGLLG